MSQSENSVTAAPVPSVPSDGGRRRRSLVALGSGIVLAGILAAVLFSGVHSQSGSNATAQADEAPGIGATSAQLMDLTVDSASQAPMAANFHLTDQRDMPISLRAFRGKVVIWSLNDDQCTDLCRLFAQDVVAADRDLGKAARDVVFLAVNANPFYPALSSVRAWSVQNDLESLVNWVYVTGSPTALAKTWNSYHVTVMLDRKNRTVVHDASVQFIDPSGRLRAVGDFGEGSISTSYYSHVMAQMADDLLPASEQVHVGGPSIDASSTAGASIGDTAPNFALTSLGTNKVSELSSLLGTPLVINFWSSTCSICLEEMPALQQVATQFAKKVSFIGIDVADPRDTAAAFARRTGVHYRLLADPNGTAAASYRVDALPVTFVVSPNGTILARHPGALTAPELVAVLEMDFQNLP